MFNFILVLLTLVGFSCCGMAVYLHLQNSHEWGWFLFVGFVILGWVADAAYKIAKIGKK